MGYVQVEDYLNFYGTGDIILSEPQFIKWHIWLTMLPPKFWYDLGWTKVLVFIWKNNYFQL